MFCCLHINICRNILKFELKRPVGLLHRMYNAIIVIIVIIRLMIIILMIAFSIFRRKIHLLFPAIFKDKEGEQYCYFKGASNKLVKITSPLSGYQVFNGSALVVLCGQRAMYIEPLSLIR